jgi:Flp pilus assembly protein TadD
MLPKFRRAAACTLAAAVILAFILAAVYVQMGTERARSEQTAARLERAVALYRHGALERAEADFRAALRAEPSDWKAPYYIGVIEVRKKRFALAIPYLEQAAVLNPREPKILDALGVLYYKLGRLDMAKGYFFASLELDPRREDTKGLLESMVKIERHGHESAARSRED